MSFAAVRIGPRAPLRGDARERVHGLAEELCRFRPDGCPAERRKHAPDPVLDHVGQERERRQQRDGLEHRGRRTPVVDREQLAGVAIVERVRGGQDRREGHEPIERLGVPARPDHTQGLECQRVDLDRRPGIIRTDEPRRVARVQARHRHEGRVGEVARPEQRGRPQHAEVDEAGEGERAPVLCQLVPAIVGRLDDARRGRGDPAFAREVETPHHAVPVDDGRPVIAVGIRRAPRVHGPDRGQDKEVSREPRWHGPLEEGQRKVALEDTRRSESGIRKRGGHGSSPSASTRLGVADMR